MFGSLSFVVASRSYVEGTTSISRICKQTCLIIEKWDYQRWIKHFYPFHSLVNPLTDCVFYLIVYY